MKRGGLRTGHLNVRIANSRGLRRCGCVRVDAAYSTQGSARPAQRSRGQRAAEEPLAGRGVRAFPEPGCASHEPAAQAPAARGPCCPRAKGAVSNSLGVLREALVPSRLLPSSRPHDVDQRAQPTFPLIFLFLTNKNSGAQVLRDDSLGPSRKPSASVRPGQLPARRAPQPCSPHSAAAFAAGRFPHTDRLEPAHREGRPGQPSAGVGSSGPSFEKLRSGT